LVAALGVTEAANWFTVCDSPNGAPAAKLVSPE
jgi:hypothetical protein